MMKCTKCPDLIVKGQPYFRTKKGPHHMQCGIKNLSPEMPPSHDELQAELDRIKAALKDPQTVHVSILRGEIALTKDAARHIACVDQEVAAPMHEPLSEYADRYAVISDALMEKHLWVKDEDYAALRAAALAEIAALRASLTKLLKFNIEHTAWCQCSNGPDRICDCGRDAAIARAEAIGKGKL